MPKLLLLCRTGELSSTPPDPQLHLRAQRGRQGQGMEGIRGKVQGREEKGTGGRTEDSVGEDGRKGSGPGLP